jgi:D-apiose dehydrogenase
MGMTTPLRGAAIGCGFFGQNHLHAWRDLEDAELVAVCDVDEAKARAAAEAFGVPRHYTDAAAMLGAEQLDFVDVITTMPTHRPLVELAASHGVPVIVQKPFAPTIEDCRAIVEACRAAGVPLMVHENFRFQTPLMKVREVVDSGVLGRVFFGRCSFRTNFDVYANQPYLAKEERLIILDLAIHLLDVARFLFGEVESLACVSTTVRDGVRAEDAASMLLRHEGGTACFVDCTYESRQDPDPFPETLIEIDGKDGTLRLMQDYRMRVVTGSGTEERDVSPRLLPWAQRPLHVVQESVLETQRHFIECLRRGREPATSGADNLRTYALCEAAYRSAETGEAVRPTD